MDCSLQEAQLKGIIHCLRNEENDLLAELDEINRKLEETRIFLKTLREMRSKKEVELRNIQVANRFVELTDTQAADDTLNEKCVLRVLEEISDNGLVKEACTGTHLNPHSEIFIPRSASPLENTKSSTTNELPSPRTTIIIKKLPHGMGNRRLKELLDDRGFGGKYDFIYCPLNLSEEQHGFLGYGFVNFFDHDDAESLIKCPLLQLKLSVVDWARRQGFQNNVDAIKNSALNGPHVKLPDCQLTKEDYLPLIFDKGQAPMPPKPFPDPDCYVGCLRPRSSISEPRNREICPFSICVLEIPLKDGVDTMLNRTFSGYCFFPGERIEEIKYGMSVTYAFIRFSKSCILDRIFESNASSDVRTAKLRVKLSEEEILCLLVKSAFTPV